MSDKTLEKMNPQEQQELKAAQVYADILYELPTYQFDWMPFARAISEGGGTITRRSDLVNPYINSYASPVDVHMSRNDHNIDNESKRVPRVGLGAWDYVWYIPEWSHPDFDPNVITTYNSPPKPRTNRDPINRLRPALLAADLVRNPTEWAMRFGIHPEELGGRSRLSPTVAPSRDPFEDYATQINLLTAAEREEAIEASRSEAMTTGKGPDYIAPSVIEGLLQKSGALTGRQLKDTLQKTVGRAGPKSINLDEFVDGLNKTRPIVTNSHKNYLDRALHDQDYQRLLFRGMTSDELVNGNILTMSNDVISDLQGEIHP